MFYNPEDRAALRAVSKTVCESLCKEDFDEFEAELTDLMREDTNDPLESFEAFLTFTCNRTLDLCNNPRIPKHVEREREMKAVHDARKLQSTETGSEDVDGVDEEDEDEEEEDEF